MQSVRYLAAILLQFAQETHHTLRSCIHTPDSVSVSLVPVVMVHINQGILQGKEPLWLSELQHRDDW